MKFLKKKFYSALIKSNFFLRIVHEEMFIEMHKWLTAICQHIDTQDACLVDEVTNNHKKMIDWMIQSLIRLARDREELSNEIKKLIYNPNTSIEVIVKNGEKLIVIIENFTVYLMGYNICKEKKVNLFLNFIFL